MSCSSCCDSSPPSNPKKTYFANHFPNANNFDLNYTFDKIDMFRNTQWFSNYVTMSQPKIKSGSLPNLGFYFLWEAKDNNKNPKPVLVTLSGGPGNCVMTKAFGTYNPLDIDPIKKILINNPHSIADRFNLLYIESPVGNGFSKVFNKNYVKSFDTVAHNAGECIQDLLNRKEYQN